jgi:hypothetical protein
MTRSPSARSYLSLRSGVDATPHDELYDWLSGSESQESDPSSEYIAITCLTMAADEARVRLRQI